MTPSAELAHGPSIEPLGVDDCIRLLEAASLGRLAFVYGDKPQIVPVNVRYHRGALIFRTDYGTVLDAVHGEHVAFEIDDSDPASHTGWSVVVHGKAEEVWRPEELQAARELSLRPWAPGSREHYIRIMPAAITGRRIAYAHVSSSSSRGRANSPTGTMS